MVDISHISVSNPTEFRPVISVLEVALTPAFLLVALGSILNIFSVRLSRIVDRIRALESAYPDSAGEEHDRIVAELRTLSKRMDTVGRSILLGVLSAICVATMIITLFVMGVAGHAVAIVVIGLFTAALMLLVAALLLFVKETRLAARMLHVRQDYLELPKKTRSRQK